MSDPVEQGEQVDVERARRIAEKWTRLTWVGTGSGEGSVDGLALSHGFLALLERVRLLEQESESRYRMLMLKTDEAREAQQREKGLREALQMIAQVGKTPTTRWAAGIASEALAATQASDD